MSSKDRVRIGCDPEIFLKNAAGTIVPVTGLVGGSKHAPVPLLSLIPSSMPSTSAAHFKKYYKAAEYGVLEDGACIEFNTPSFREWDTFCGQVAGVTQFLESWAASKSLSLAYNTPEATFSADTFEKALVLKEIGCSPDFDAYSNTNSRRPLTHADLGLTRYSGGHIHLGYNVDLVPPYIMAKLCDILLGLPLIILGEKQKGRRRFYGQAGLYRPKPYGVEYRTPSNLWLQYASTSAFMYLTSGLLRLGAMVDTHLPVLKAMFAPGAIPWAEVQRAINEEDRVLACDVFQYIHRQFTDVTATTQGAIKSYEPIWTPDYGLKEKKSAKAKPYPPAIEQMIQELRN